MRNARTSSTTSRAFRPRPCRRRRCRRFPVSMTTTPATDAGPPAGDDDALIAGADWPVFGWADDIRPALREAFDAGRPCVLATLYRVEGSAPRGPGAQMLFDGSRVTGYFSGDCIEADVALHAAEVAASGEPQWLHYGMGSPWIDIRLRCGGALYILAERIAPDQAAALLGFADAR